MAFGILKFIDDGFDAVVCLNGDIPSIEVFDAYASYPLIAADGAAVGLNAIGVGAEYIVGDLDSIPSDVLETFRGTSEIVVDIDQEVNDFEKALRFAASQLWSRVLVLGMHGGEMEHTLNNWSVLMRFARTMQVTSYEKGRVAIPVFDSFVFEPNEDELISLIPQPQARVTTSGLVWPLNNEDLTLGMREGARNRSSGGTVSVTIHEGSLLFFCDARLPRTPVLGT